MTLTCSLHSARQACTPLGKPLGNGLVEVSVGPQSSPLVYVSVLKPGMGLVTGQVLGPVAGFTQNQDGKVVGLNGENTKIVYPDPPFTSYRTRAATAEDHGKMDTFSVLSAKASP